MNLTIITPFENSLTRRGNRLPFLASLLVKSGHSVQYISSDFNHGKKSSFSKYELDNIPKKDEYNQIFLHVPGYHSNLSLGRIVTHLIFSIKIFFYLMSHPSPDLVIIPSRPPELIFVVTLARFLKKNKMIIDISDIWPDGFPYRNFTYVLFSMYCNFFQYLSLPFQRHFVITAPMFLKWITRYQKNYTHRFITLGYDIERWKHNRPIEKINQEIKFVYIGNIDQTINLYPLINGIKTFKNYSLTVIGEGDNFQETKKYIENNNIKNVFFYGVVDKNAVPLEIEKFHIFVIPMIYGTLPNKLFDSLASYKPILGFGNNDTTKFITNNDIGWVLEFDEKETFQFLTKFEVTDIIKKSKNVQKIRELYSKEYLYKQYIDYITEILQ